MSTFEHRSVWVSASVRLITIDRVHIVLIHRYSTTGINRAVFRVRDLLKSSPQNFPIVADVEGQALLTITPGLSLIEFNTNMPNRMSTYLDTGFLIGHLQNYYGPYDLSETANGADSSETRPRQYIAQSDLVGKD